MRTVPQSGSFVPVEVIKLCSFDSEVLCLRTNNASRGSFIEFFLSIFSSSNDQSTYDLGPAVYDVVRQGHFHSSKKVVSSLEIVEHDTANSICDSTISTIFVSDQVVEVCYD